MLYERAPFPILLIRKFSRGYHFRESSHAKFRENKSSRTGEIIRSFTDEGKSCHCREFLASQICLLTLFAKIKVSRAFPNLQ